ncbi:MAG: phage major capsid protein [Gordonia sp. (in: high G+C Gram-positive bacteria)]|uniref:phage major capsid protein n=1 Tax=Gordonia sp. (in: high G+C Gram-positive bacteria) TaxID=84139 RepID=UPI003BB4EA65
MKLSEKRDALLKQAQGLIAQRKSAGTELSEEDRAALADYKKKIDDLNGQISAANEDAAIVAAFSKVTSGDGANGEEGAKSGVLTAKNLRAVAGNLAAKALNRDATFGQKSMNLVGASDVIVTAFAQTPEKPVELLDVLPVVGLRTSTPAKDGDLAVGGSGATFRYLRQTLRTNNAAPVAPGAAKPVSKYGITPVDSALQVIAHLTEEIDKYTLRDVPGLTQFLTNELLFGLRASLEHQIINGTGTAPQLSGILGTTGIQTQAAGTDIALTVRSSITKLETEGYAPSAIVLSPADWERVETSTASGSGEFLFQTGPVDRAARTLWGVPVVCSTSLPTDRALLISDQSVAVYTDGRMDLEWEQGGELFEKNQLRARFESRFQTAVLRPRGVVLATLPTAGTGE